jgi:hypothetical protein
VIDRRKTTATLTVSKFVLLNFTTTNFKLSQFFLAVVTTADIQPRLAASKNVMDSGSVREENKRPAELEDATSKEDASNKEKCEDDDASYKDYQARLTASGIALGDGSVCEEDKKIIWQSVEHCCSDCDLVFFLNSRDRCSCCGRAAHPSCLLKTNSRYSVDVCFNCFQKHKMSYSLAASSEDRTVKIDNACRNAISNGKHFLSMALKLLQPEAFQEKVYAIYDPQDAPDEDFLPDADSLPDSDNSQPLKSSMVLRDRSNRSSNIHWIQCDNCKKWRTYPAGMEVPDAFICSDNHWNKELATCKAEEEEEIAESDDSDDEYSLDQFEDDVDSQYNQDEDEEEDQDEAQEVDKEEERATRKRRASTDTNIVERATRKRRTPTDNSERATRKRRASAGTDNGKCATRKRRTPTDNGERATRKRRASAGTDNGKYAAYQQLHLLIFSTVNI